MRFLIDMQLPAALTKWLAGLGHDAVHAGQIGLHRASDEIILEAARVEDRVVITADLDYPRIMRRTKAPTPGIVLLRGGDFNEDEARERITRALEKIESHRLTDAIVVVDRHRLRRRPLPLEI